MKALIVDDSRFMRAHLRQLLEQMAVECVDAADGEEALEKVLAAEDGFDFMLLDVNMPKMSGLECLRRLQEQGPQGAMKVVMVTTESDNSFIRNSLDYGADEFLMKPFTAEALREKLAMVGLAA
jgi:two-component system chemotaxis response regulator CheY